MSKICCSDWNRTSDPYRVIPRRSTTEIHNNRLDSVALPERWCGKKTVLFVAKAHAVVHPYRHSG